MKFLHNIINSLLLSACLAFPGPRLLVLPFADEVELREAWDLRVDVPRWFSATFDTACGETKFEVVEFDSVMSFIQDNSWTPQNLESRATIQTVSKKFRAHYVISGRVKRFKLVKRAINTDASLGGSHFIAKSGYGSGGATILGGLQSYGGDICIEVRMHDGFDGKLIETRVLEANEKDGGLNIYLPSQQQNSELDFHYMSRAPFGSEYFNRTVAGTVMRSFSCELRQFVLQAQGEPQTKGFSQTAKAEGTILGRSGRRMYIDLGTGDNLFLGEQLTVLAPVRPFIDASGDTLGWEEKPAGTVGVRYIKSKHFSEVELIEEKDSIRVGWTVRPEVETDDQGH